MVQWHVLKVSEGAYLQLRLQQQPNLPRPQQRPSQTPVGASLLKFLQHTYGSLDRKDDCELTPRRVRRANY